MAFNLTKKNSNKKIISTEVELTNRNHLILCLLDSIGMGDKSALINQMIQDYLIKHYAMLKEIPLFSQSLKEWDAKAKI